MEDNSAIGLALMLDVPDRYSG